MLGFSSASPQCILPLVIFTPPNPSQTLVRLKSSLDKSSLVLNSDKKRERVSLVAQWLRVCLPMQGTRVRALVWEDPTCRGATGPVSHNY